MEEELTKKQVCTNLKKLYDESQSRVEADAMVRRAYTKFKEGSKNYDTTKKLVSETLANYEKTLIELSEFYDGKIEQLILRKVELEASLVGSILNEEYLSEKVIRKNEQKDNDKVKKSVAENIKSAIEKITNRKKNKNEIDFNDISKLMDGQDVANEIDSKLNKRVEKTVEDKKANKEFLDKVEKEIALIDDEIDKINERKKQSMYDAMEVGDLIQQKLLNQV